MNENILLEELSKPVIDQLGLYKLKQSYKNKTTYEDSENNMRNTDKTIFKKNSLLYSNQERVSDSRIRDVPVR